MIKAVADLMIAVMVASNVPAAEIEQEEQITEQVAVEAQVQTEEPDVLEEPVIPKEPVIPDKPIVTEQPKTENQKFDHDIASYITKYSGSETLNRNYNMRLASNSINGVILKPGESFSYNDTILAKSHKGRDYKEAGIFANGEVSTGIGGGICQISSTLYQAALYSGMTITQRANHSMRVGYMPAGRDATASWGSIDLKFKNQLKVPVMIESVMKNGTIKVRFLSQGIPDIGKIDVTVTQRKDGAYVLKRIRDGGIVDYTAVSIYKQPKK